MNPTTVQRPGPKKAGGRPRLSAAAAAALGGAAAAALLLTGAAARPAAAQEIGGSALVWQDIAVGERVPISRALFDASGYWLFTADGHTIFVPFTDHDLYVLRFARSYDGRMYLEVDGDGPILYLPDGGRLENAAVPDGYWYPFPPDYSYTGPVYMGIAPSWTDFTSMSWYPGMSYYGGYWAYHPWYSYGAPFPPVVNTYCVIGNRRYHGWHSYEAYCREHPRPPAFHSRTQYGGPFGVPISPRPLPRPGYVPGQGHVGSIPSVTGHGGISSPPWARRRPSSPLPQEMPGLSGPSGPSGLPARPYGTLGAAGGQTSAAGSPGAGGAGGVQQRPAGSPPGFVRLPPPDAGVGGREGGEWPRWVSPRIRWEGQPGADTGTPRGGSAHVSPERPNNPNSANNPNYEGGPAIRPYSGGGGTAPVFRPGFGGPAVMPSRPNYSGGAAERAPTMQAPPAARPTFGGGGGSGGAPVFRSGGEVRSGGERAPASSSRPAGTHDGSGGRSSR